MSKRVAVNGRLYNRSERPVVVVCVDGSEPAYMETAMARGRMPWLKSLVEREDSTNVLAESVIPSFTNPNNLSIVSGCPPRQHGICGNYFYNQETGEEELMNDASYYRAKTIFKAFQEAGASVAVVTAKDKLRKLLGHGLDFSGGTAVCFSSEASNKANLSDNGIENVNDFVGLPVPSVYSSDLSEFVFAAGVKLLERDRPELMYLSTTDFIQHKFAPEEEGALAFYEMMDGYWAKLDALGAIVVLTADHGMKPKHNSEGRPNVFYLQDQLDEWYGENSCRVILPITDPYVVHHGALGSFATAYLPDGVTADEACARLSSVAGVEVALSGPAGCDRYELPEDRMGDIIVITEDYMSVGTSEDRHDLSALDRPLRTHGGLSEQVVPFISNCAMPALPNDMRLRNFDAFYCALNYAV
ncbi:phosphonoacetate hydrolase [Kiloniella sp. b19]|uniref:phosphonoacetate hydrolase n=1 Tax=Kiloniella sp. GXU_MW_B19 TaxID=3141326 RepID=UPI0031D7DB11